MLLSQFPLTFCQTQNRMPCFHRIACDYSHADWDSLCDHLRDVRWENTFKLDGSAAASEFFEWVQVGIDVSNVNPQSSTWFSAACAAVMAHRNHFFPLPIE